MPQPPQSGHTEQLTGGDFINDAVTARGPFALFELWMSEAARSEINDPNAMCLATTDASGQPNVRVVLLKGVDGRGFVFFTNTESAKGLELDANPRAAVVFHWKSLGRQVRVRGTVQNVTGDEADAYYASRPRGSRIGAWASRQSRPLSSRAELEQAVRDTEARYPGEAIPRPPHWTGYRIIPLAIEFWHDRPYRLHDRLLFQRVSDADGWTTSRLYP